MKRSVRRIIKRVEFETGMRCSEAEPHWFEFYCNISYRVAEMDGGVTTEYNTFTEKFHSVREMFDYVR